MEEFAPLLLLLLFWVFIGLPVSVAKKAASQKKPGQPAVRKVPADNQPAEVTEMSEPQLKTLVPTLSEPDHDDSVFTGSLGALSTEGFDPCHEEQLSGMEPVCKPERTEPVPEAVPGLSLRWTGSDIVRGVVMSEILNRKRA